MMPPPGCKIEPNPRHTVIKFAKLFCGFKRNKLALINDNAVLSTYKSPIEKSRYFTDPFRALFRPSPHSPPTSATRPSSTSTLQMSMCYFPNGRRCRGRPLENEAVRRREGGRGGASVFYATLPSSDVFRHHQFRSLFSGDFLVRI